MKTFEGKSDIHLLKRAYSALEKAQARINELDVLANEPIAIIGMSCRLPGDIVDPVSLWEVLKKGADCITDFPQERTTNPTARNSTDDIRIRKGGFLSSADLFDNAFFGITEEEAKAMDPQQRILLEVTWHALENAGQTQEQLNGSDTGVYIGVFNNDYSHFQVRDENLENITAATSPGTNFSVLPGRLSHFLGLHGPSLAVDAACASSLVAVHLACQALRQKECSQALVGGVNLVLSTATSFAVSKMGMLSPSGRCKPFDSTADGFVRSEGCAVLVLKRLSDADRNKDNILAIIRGSSVNQMGRSSTLTAPSGLAQEVVINNALNRSHINPRDVGYVEAHGTGSLLGDAMEIQSYVKVLCKDRAKDSPLLIGSLKGNLGHMEAASGIGAIIKAVLCIQKGEIPPTINLRQLNPDFRGNKFPIEFPTKQKTWGSKGKPRIAAVHSFGFSGSIAHALIQEHSSARTDEATASWMGPYLLCISAKTLTALDALMESYVGYLKDLKNTSLADICYTANVKRTHLKFRTTVIGNSREELIDALIERQARLKDCKAEEVSALSSVAMRPALLLCDPNQEFVDASIEELSCFPEFQSTLEQFKRDLAHISPESQSFLDGSTKTCLTSDLPAELRDCLFCGVQLAAAKVWEVLGLIPAVVIGSGLGQYTAQIIGGRTSTQDIMRLLLKRRSVLGGLLSLDSFTQLAKSVKLNSEDKQIVLISSGTRQSLHTDPDSICRNLWQLSAPDADIEALFKKSKNLHQRIILSLGNHASINEIITDKVTCIVEFPNEVPQAREGFLSAIRTLHEEGIRIDFSKLYPMNMNLMPGLPNYPFERKRYWYCARTAGVPEEKYVFGEDDSVSSYNNELIIKSLSESDVIPVHNKYLEKLAQLPKHKQLDFISNQIKQIVQQRLVDERIFDASQEIGEHENLIELGVQSLAAIAIKANIEKEFDLSCQNTLLFEYPRISDLSEFIFEAIYDTTREMQPQPSTTSMENNLKSSPDLPKITPDLRNRHEPFFLRNLVSSYFMSRLANFELSIRSHDYFENDVSGLDLSKYEEAWNQLIQHHEMLRAIVLADGQFKILPSTPRYKIKIVDLVNEENEKAQQTCVQIRNEMITRQYKPDQWPLFDIRVTLLENRIRIHFDCDLLILDYNTYYLLNRDLEKLYRGESLEPVKISYRDYMCALTEIENNHLFEKEKDYWWKRLDALPGAPELPLKRAISSIGKHPGFELRHAVIDCETWKKVKEHVRASGMQLSAAVMTIFAQVLSLFSSSNHFILNVMTFNRLPFSPDVYEMVGNCASTFLLEVDLRDQVSFRELCRKIQHQILNDVENLKTTTGLQVMQEINRRRNTSGTAPFPIAFSSTFAHQLSKNLLLKPIGTNSTFNLLETPGTYLDHVAGENEDGSLFLSWYVVKDLFEEGFIENMLDSYVNHIKTLSDGSLWDTPVRPQTTAGDLGPRMRANATAGGMLATGLLHAPFLSQVETNGKRMAVISEDRELSYDEIFQRANQIADIVDKHGVSRSPIALIMHKGWEQVVGVYGSLIAGCPYIPIDAELPEERMREILSNANVAIVLTQSRVANKLTGFKDIHILEIDTLEGFERHTERRRPLQHQEDTAYIIYTSGSTGKPKGVMMTHRAVINTILDCNERFDVTENDVFLGVSQLSFDLSVYDIFGAAAAGATLVLPEYSKRTDPTHWMDLIDRHNVTIWNSAPPLMVMMADFAEIRNGHLLESLRLVMLSGDWIPVSLPRQIWRFASKAKIYSLGGATEAAIWSIIYPVKSETDCKKSIPYGKPLRNQKFYVLNENYDHCPTWVPGELCIAGVGLALGYYDDQDLTSNKFVKNPVTGERLYRTGDKGRYLPDGNIEFLGRIDFQVKLQGHRIELGEIESILLGHYSVKSVLVTVTGDNAANKQLVSYVVRSDKAKVSGSDLAEYLSKKLPSYMVPKHYVFLDSFPLSNNGKLDRKSLPAVRLEDKRTEEKYTPPNNDTERSLVQIWQSLLAQPEISVNDNFFDLGGQSFLAVRMMAQIHKKFGRDLPLSILFENPTIANLAHHLDAAGPESYSPLVVLRKEGNKSPIFFIHPVGGNVFCYGLLANTIDKDYPIYALQSRGLSAGESPFSSFSEMVDVYIQEILRVQPRGPYRIAGWSLGGSVAFEIATQLQIAGAEIEWVGMFDSPAPYKLPEVDERDLLAWFVTDLSGIDNFISADELKQDNEEAQLRYLLDKIVSAGIFSNDISESQFARLINVFRMNLKLQREYSEISGPNRVNPVTLYKATQDPSHYLRKYYPYIESPDMGWFKLTSDIVIVDVPGNHYTILSNNNVESLSEAIMTSIVASESLDNFAKNINRQTTAHCSSE